MVTAVLCVWTIHTSSTPPEAQVVPVPVLSIGPVTTTEVALELVTCSIMTTEVNLELPAL